MSLSVATAAIPLPAIAAAQDPGAPAQDDTVRAKQLYQEGKTAYRLGNFDVAVEKFEGAYAISELPTILYNIGLAYERLYTTSNDVAHLRKSKVLLQNFLLETQKDLSLGDPGEVKQQIELVDKKIDAHEQRIAERESGIEAEREKARRAQEEAETAKARLDEIDQIPVGSDPGKLDRRRGGAFIGMGVAAGVLGGVGAWLYGMQGQNFEDDYKANVAENTLIGCADPSDNVHCEALEEQRAGLERNGEKANDLALAVGISGAVVGVALIGTGIGLMVRGNKRTKKWKGGSDLSIAPTGRGLVLSGRF